MAEEKHSLSSSFNWASIGKFALKAAFWIGVTFIGGGLLDFNLMHNHGLGTWLQSMFGEPILQFYDWTARAIGKPELARNSDFLSPVTGGACIPDFDPMGLPLPCFG